MLIRVFNLFEQLNVTILIGDSINPLTSGRIAAFAFFFGFDLEFTEIGTANINDSLRLFKIGALIGACGVFCKMSEIPTGYLWFRGIP